MTIFGDMLKSSMDPLKMRAFEFLEYTTQRATYLFRLFGYARSGQHAISHWLMQQGNPSGLWINNLQGYGEGVDFKHYWYGPIDLNNIHLVGLGFEGDLRRLSHHFAEVPVIMVIRDVYNQTASIAKHPDLQVNTGYFEAWRRNALQALGEINLLHAPCLVVKYNDWVSSEGAKQKIYSKIKECLCLPFTYQTGKDKQVIGIGGGSSFDGTQHSGQANEMKVLQRYQDPSVQEALQKIPQELKDLSERLFPGISVGAST